MGCGSSHEYTRYNRGESTVFNDEIRDKIKSTFIKFIDETAGNWSDLEKKVGEALNDADAGVKPVKPVEGGSWKISVSYNLKQSGFDKEIFAFYLEAKSEGGTNFMVKVHYS